MWVKINFAINNAYKLVHNHPDIAVGDNINSPGNPTFCPRCVQPLDH